MFHPEFIGNKINVYRWALSTVFQRLLSISLMRQAVRLVQLSLQSKLQWVDLSSRQSNYEQWVWEIDFLWLEYNTIASLLVNKGPYSTTMGWLRCRLSYSLLCSLIMCIQGAYSSIHHFDKQLASCKCESSSMNQSSHFEYLTFFLQIA